MVIDAAGECGVLRRGGVPTVAGGNFFTHSPKYITLDGCKEAVETADISRTYKGRSVGGGGINLYGGQPDDIPRWSGLTVEEVNDYLARNQLLTPERVKKTDRLSRDIAMIPIDAPVQNDLPN